MDNRLTANQAGEIQIQPDAATLAHWSAKPGPVLSGLIALVRRLPRGRGVVPHWFGRIFCKGMKRSVRLPNGTIVAIDPRNLDVYVGNVLAEDYNVDHILRALLAVLQNAWDSSSPDAPTPHVVYDIGANAGFISLQLANILRDKIRVYAFEPQERLAATLAVSTRLNEFENVSVFRTLVGDRAGEAELFVPRNGVLASSVWWNANTPGVRTIRCPIVTLDGLLASGQIAPPSLIKVDVEGAERTVIEGAKELLRQHRPIVVFESWAKTPEQVSDRVAIMDVIRSAANYTFHFVDSAAFRAVTDVSDQQSVDIVAVPDGLRLPAAF